MVETHLGPEKLKTRWRSFVYAFFEQTPVIRRVPNPTGSGTWRVLYFWCANKGKCSQGVQRFLDSGNKSSTGNLNKHAKNCWGVAAFEAGKTLGKAETLRQVVNVVRETGKLTTAFDFKHLSKPTYSNIGHTREEIW
jgi:hypothetical protein